MKRLEIQYDSKDEMFLLSNIFSYLAKGYKLKLSKKGSEKLRKLLSNAKFVETEENDEYQPTMDDIMATIEDIY